ncbi:hypothetical protein ACWDOP_27745 [Nocardia sp. NPDC003693]
MLADESCTPAGELNTAAVLERTRAFLAASDQLPFDLPTLHAATDALHAFLRDHDVAEPLILRPTAELGAIPAILDYGPLTLLTNLGFDIYEGKAHHTVPLSEVTVENSLDLAYVTADTASLLLSLGSMVAGMGGVGSEILTPVTIARAGLRADEIRLAGYAGRTALHVRRRVTSASRFGFRYPRNERCAGAGKLTFRNIRTRCRPICFRNPSETRREL